MVTRMAPITPPQMWPIPPNTTISSSGHHLHDRVVVRVDEARRQVSGEAAGAAGVERADQEREQLVFAHIDAGRGGRDRVLAQGLEGAADVRAQDGEREVGARERERHHEVVVLRRRC